MAYSLDRQQNNTLKLNLATRLSTDSNGIAECLGLQADPNIDLAELIAKLEAKISDHTLLQLG